MQDNNSFTDQIKLTRARILADAREARELLHAQVDQVLLCAYDRCNSSAEVAATAHRLASVDPDNKGGGNLVLQNMLTQLEQLRSSRKNAAIGCYGRSSFGSKLTPEPMSLEMVLPLFSYFVGQQPQPEPLKKPQKPTQTTTNKESCKSADSSKSAKKSKSPVNKTFSISSSKSSSPATSASNSPSTSFIESSSSSVSSDFIIANVLSHKHKKLSSSNIDSMNNMNDTPIEWSPSSSGYSSQEEDQSRFNSNNHNNNIIAPSNSISHFPLDLSTGKSWPLQPQQQRQQKFPEMIVPKLVIKEEAEDSFTTTTSLNIMLPPKKRKYGEMANQAAAVKNEAAARTPMVTAAKAVVFQDELKNNFAQANRKENMLTLGRKCLIDDCPIYFADKPSMHAHMAAEHAVLQFACQTIGCNESFDAQQGLTAHLTHVHSSIASFGCPKCGKHFRKYEQMSHHIYAEHQVGVFRCAISDCGFEGSRRSEVSRHFEKEHRKYICAECGRSFTYTGHLRTHERSHMRVKPFRCRWPECGYVTENKSHAVSHIRVRHFGLPPTRKLQVALGITDARDPLQFLDIDEELIVSTREAFKEAAMRRRQLSGSSEQQQPTQEVKQEEGQLEIVLG